MVEWVDEAIILENKKYNENSNIATAISKDHGVYSAILKYAFSNVNRSTFQIGNIVKLTWKARLGEQMGCFTGDIEKNTGSELFNNKLGIFAVNTSTFLIKSSLTERITEKEIYYKLYNLITSYSEAFILKKNYLYLEETILKNCGYALDYSKCAVTGTRKNLYYLSPKTGKAVCKEIGDPYADKLFILPNFFISKNEEISQEDLIKGFKITGYFIEKHLLQPKNLHLPETRNMLIYSD
jgi:DNA repair protein RecO (recombination protein O)